MNVLKLSICVPVHNAAKHIEQCVRSLFEQTYNNLEYVFVDDGSSDDSRGIIERLAREYPRTDGNIKLIRLETNGGAARARRLALESAQGTLVAFCDADDWLEPDHYRRMIERMVADEADIACCSTVLCASCGSERKVSENEDLVLSGGEVVKRFDRVPGIGSLVLKVWRRELFDKSPVVPAGLKVAEDVCICTQLLARARRVSFVNDVYYHYRIHGDSMIQTVPAPIIVRDHQAVYATLTSALAPEVRRTVCRYLSRVVLYWGTAYGIFTRSEFVEWRDRYTELGGEWDWSDKSPWGQRMMRLASRSYVLARLALPWVRGRIHDCL